MNLARLGSIALAMGLGVGSAFAQDKTLPASADREPPAKASQADVGAPAPDFTLASVAGKEHALSAFRGKIVVLEWFDPECPYVAKHHERNATMRDLARTYADREVVWLAVVSGRAASDLEGLRDAIKRWQIEYPVLLDPRGMVARLYGARVTPHMFVIDTEGTLAYAGAIDESADRETLGETNYVERAVNALLAGEPVGIPSTFPYGTGLDLAADRP